MFKESDLRIASPVYQLLFEASQPHPAKRQLASDWITLLSFAALANLEMCKTDTSIGLPASSKLTRGDAGLVVAFRQVLHSSAAYRGLFLCFDG